MGFSLGDIVKDLDQATAAVVYGGDSAVEKLAKVLYENARAFVGQKLGHDAPKAQLDALGQYGDWRANLMTPGAPNQYGGHTLSMTDIYALAAAAGLSQAFVDSPASTAAQVPSANVFNQISSDVKSAAKTVTQDVKSAASTVSSDVKSAASTVSSDVKSGNYSQLGKQIVGAAKSVGSQVAGAAKSVGSQVAGAAKSVAGQVATDATHLENAIANAAKDLVNDVEGALDTLVTLIKGLSPAAIVKMVEKDMATILPAIEKGMGITPGPIPPPTAAPASKVGVKGTFHAATGIRPSTHSADAKKPLDPNEIDFSFLPIPKSGLASVPFPSQLRGQTVYWKDARKNAFSIVWYLAALAIVDFEHMIKLALNMLGSDFKKIAKVFGIKTADAPQGRALGADPIPVPLGAPTAGAASSTIAVVVGVITAATALVAALSPLILGMVGKNSKAGKAIQAAQQAAAVSFCTLNPGDPSCQPPSGSNYLIMHPPGTAVPPPPHALTKAGSSSGHSSSSVTGIVVALAVGLLALFLISQNKHEV